MNKKSMLKLLMLFSLGIFLLSVCSDDAIDKDMDKPSIDMSFKDAFPLNCTVVYKGETFTFSGIFTDNQELGSYNLEIHNNFDHHSHSTYAEDCDLEPNKSPINPFVYNKDFLIPDGKKVYNAINEIFVPENIDSGDYHFSIRVTDKAGWQQMKAISLKITNRN